MFTTTRVPASICGGTMIRTPLLQHRGLVGGGRGLALHHRIGLDHLEHGGLGQARHQRPVLVALHRDRHAFLQERQAVAEQALPDRDLLEGLLVHEMKLRVLLVEELVLLLVQAHALDRLDRAEALVELGAVDQILELDLLVGGALAGLDVLGPDHAPQPVPVLEHVARANVVGADLHDLNSKGSALRPRRSPRATGACRPRRHPGSATALRSRR